MISMSELKDNIKIVRELLINTMEIRENPLDPEIVSLGDLLNSLLNEYIRLNESMGI